MQVPKDAPAYPMSLAFERDGGGHGGLLVHQGRKTTADPSQKTIDEGTRLEARSPLW